MSRLSYRARGLLALAALPMLASVADAGPMLQYDSGYSQIVRATGQAIYPLTTDASGRIYFVTGTAPGDQLRRVNLDGSVEVLYGATNGVIGTVADLEFAFGGDLFANDALPPGVRRFAVSGSNNSTFWTNPLAGADAGLAFDQVSQTLYVSVAEKILAVDSSGGTTLVTQGRVGAGPDLALSLEPTGTILSIHGDGIVSRIDPVAHTYNSFLDLGMVLPQWQQFKSLDVNPDTGKVILTLDVSIGPTHRELWMMNPDGSDLSLFAEGSAVDGIDGPLNAKWGKSADGSGNWSIYAGLNESGYIVEFRPVAVPEAGSILLCLIGTAMFILLGERRSQATGVR